MKRTQLYWQSILIVAFAAVGTLFAAQTGDALKIPGEFNSTKPIATDPVKQCFNCHVPQKAQDFTFSKYLE